MFASILVFGPPICTALDGEEARDDDPIDSLVCLCALVGWDTLVGAAGHLHWVCEVKSSTQVRLMTAEYGLVPLHPAV